MGQGRRHLIRVMRPSALARARLAEHIVRERLKMRGFTYPEIRVDYIGMSSLHGMGEGRAEPYEVKPRIAARSLERKAAQAVGFEMRTLHVNGPSGGGGGTNALREVMGVKAVLALNFVIENALGGGVTISLEQDAHGKSLSYVMLGIELHGDA